MAVIKHLRDLSNMEFYKTAIYIRRDMTQWLLRDFGAKKHPKNVRQVVKDISDEDAEKVDAIFEKYGVKPKREYQSEYPQWFTDYERNIISNLLTEMVTNIIEANSIYPTHRKDENGEDKKADIVYESECGLRRTLQDKAIAVCYRLYQELQYIQSLFPQDLNRFCPLLGDIEREVDLLKGWRQSDNKRFPT